MDAFIHTPEGVGFPAYCLNMPCLSYLQYYHKVVELKAEVKEIEAFITKFEALKPQN